MLQRMKSNKYKNNKHCDITQFTKMGDIMSKNDNFEMIERKKRKRAIRLHPSSYRSCNGLKKNENINSEQFKKIANQCYVNNNNKNRNDNDCMMDCD